MGRCGAGQAGFQHLRGGAGPKSFLKKLTRGGAGGGLRVYKNLNFEKHKVTYIFLR